MWNTGNVHVNKALTPASYAFESSDLTGVGWEADSDLLLRE